MVARCSSKSLPSRRLHVRLRVRRHREVWRRGQSQLGQRCPAEEQQETETTLTETSRTTVRCQAASTCRVTWTRLMNTSTTSFDAK